MLFPTVAFAVFFALVFLVNWLLRPFPTPWKLFMLAASYFFYGWWQVRFCLLLAGSTVANQVLAVKIHRAASQRGRTAWLAVTVATNLAVLGWFKYYGFFVESVTGGLAKLGLHPNLPLVQVVLPVGISFFTFHALSYVIDVYRGTIEPAAAIDFAVYMAFFPHLVAGPIVRASELVPQILDRPDPRTLDSALAFRLVVVGLFKKVVISTYVASAVVDPVFAVPKAHSSLEVLAAVYGYAVQIYADFSGYTDIAIGCALLLGFRFPKNFDCPYSAKSVQEFWHRWHMTLSRWLRDYLYIPLGGNRGSPSRVRRNLMLTMLLGGLWHGAAWTFVIWGGLHGLALVVEHGLARRRAAAGAAARVEPAPWGAFGRWVVTFNLVCLAWVFFRAETLTAAGDLLGRLVAWGPAPLVTPLLVATIAATIGAQFVPTDALQRVQTTFSRLRPAVQGTVLGFGLAVIGALAPQGVAPFIYFRF
jgi:D-alanyl-lipoteichoic acid acyltransferase DltB (MBOAT superfamily)